ncbi:uncharacterized protein [Parasteatoda tepidariorum]|uniref:CHCH domain-containing protein n=1 Tax=Parasteatoda tepidariorum TaxID=114398 RepID=A0A2L2Y5U4_PARTP|nr:uncharacterized protein LOC107455106 [Parasteatoda tepidariorum]XP_042896125.1 uncharacterized protein LOC107455106 [Parasteatoda tepidariorum]XP_042896126.1 uncharacterized protein LOC107455106 [Parasteatoda tepidariorum]
MSLPRWYVLPKTGRRPQSLRKIKFREAWPMSLDNQVSTKGGKSSEAPCLKETFAFLSCLKDNDNSHDVCRIQGEEVTKCFNKFMEKREELKMHGKNVRDFMPEKSVKDMEPTELNRFLSHFPHKLKK